MPFKHFVPTIKTTLMALFGVFAAQTIISFLLRFTQRPPSLLTGLTFVSFGQAQRPASESETCAAPTDVSLDWHAPAHWEVNDLDSALRSTGTYGFIFDSSQGPPDTYNWCNMPHVNAATYPEASTDYQLEYVEVIHRHHKRTPYAANTFPVESYSWSCDDEGLFFGGKPLNPYGNGSAATYWSVYESSANPLRPTGFNGTCRFPQITRGGLDDSFRHGEDLKAVYYDRLGFLPAVYDADVLSYRVTNNVITSQVASMVIAGMWPERRDADTPLLVQRSSIDSLEPSYPCAYADRVFGGYGPGSASRPWMRHLDGAADLKARLDAVSDVDPRADDWRKSYDHYFDNLSSRLCHDKPLPCSVSDSQKCIDADDADTVFRLGEYEYSFIYRDEAPSLRASAASFGIWIGELAQNLRDAMASASMDASQASAPSIRYRHNVAHDGSIARLLAILQLERMVWPGMGAEVVFELYRRRECHYVRVLWGGQVLRSSHPAFGAMDMVPVKTLLAYFDGVVGERGMKIPEMCQS